MRIKFHDSLAVRFLGFCALLFGQASGAFAVDTSTLLQASPNPAVYGSLVTLTAAVTPSTASGKVAFYDGTMLLGGANLSSGSASFTTSLPSAGAHSLQARYLGDPLTHSSVSSAFVVTVNEYPADAFKSVPGSPFLNTPGVITHAPTVADFNGDGIPDLAIFQNANYVNNVAVSDVSIVILLGDGKGGFTAGVPISTGFSRQAGTLASSGPVTGDFNGDGIIDLVFPEITGSQPFATTWSIALWFGDGKGGFLQAPGSPYAQESVYGDSPIVSADYNLDGFLDLVFVENDGVHVWLGDGIGNFPTKLGPFATSTHYQDNYASEAANLDFNGDGFPDFLLFNNLGLELLLGDGTGALKSAPGQPSGVLGGSDFTIADFNGDGMSDIAFVQDYYGVEVVLGNSAASLKSTQIFQTSYLSTIRSADFNGDGKSDLVIINPNYYGTPLTLQILAGDGHGGFSPPANAGALTPYPSGGLAIADFNGDGKADLAIAGGAGSYPQVFQTVQVLLGSTAQTPASITAVGGTPQSTPYGSPLSPPLQALVKDANGNPVPNVTVTFGGSAIAYPSLIVTDGNGIANFAGPAYIPATGRQTVQAIIPGVSGKADFQVTTLPENLAGSVTAVSNGFIYSRVSYTYSGSLQVATTSYYSYPFGFWSPLEVVLTGLPAGLTLNNAAGFYNGDPYFILTNEANQYSVPLTFSGPPGLTVSFTPALYMGAFQ